MTLTRRDLLRGAVGGAALLGAGTLLNACAGGGGTSPAPSGTPSKGGTLTAGLGAGGVTDGVDAHKLSSQIDASRIWNLYDTMQIRQPDFALAPSLVETFESNPTADVWVLHLRPDVEFHNGKTMTADDVIFSIQRIVDPAIGGGSASLFNIIDVANMKKLDAHTIQVPLKSAASTFPNRFWQPTTAVVPTDYDPAKPVGTGPFKFESFTPGQRSVFSAFDNYWGGRPNLDELVIVDINDDTARLNALLSGQVDVIDGVSTAQIPSIEGSGSSKLLTSKSNAWRPFLMRVDQAPFTDVRVRQAFRLMVDREQMVAQVFSGHGDVANDLYSPQDRGFAKDLPQRVQDIDQAKSLLKSAGAENLSVELVTAPIAAGAVQMATLFAQQAAQAGVNVKVTQLDSGTFFNADYLNRTFEVDYWGNDSYLEECTLFDGPGASYNGTHFDDPEFTKLYYAANAELDEGKRIGILHDMQAIQHERGGAIIWAYPHLLDAHSNKVTGLVPDGSGSPCSQYNFKKVSFVV